MPGTSEPRESREQKAERLRQFIYAQFEDSAKSPSWKEMAAAAKVSEKTLPKLLAHLQQQGEIIYRPGRWRQVFPRRKQA